MAVVPVFKGVLDGNGFCIKNLSINGAGYLGLFGEVDGSVQNLGIKKCNVSGSSDSVGGLAGRTEAVSATAIQLVQLAVLPK